MLNGKRLLIIQKLFYTWTDEYHPLSVTSILNYLRKYGISTCRNTIIGDIRTLQESGMDIISCNDGYKLVNRLFDIAEIRIIADAVASFKFLTVKKSNSIIGKIKKLCSKYDSDNIYREFHIANRIKTDNVQVLINIDAISTAIKENKQISFDYFDYDSHHQMICNGTRICSPWELAICSEEYYAVSYYLKYPTHPTNFRIDRMKNIQILDDIRIKPPQEIKIDEYLKSSFSMFGGMEENVTLQFPLTNKMCNIVYDKFGHDIPIYIKNENFFQIHVPIKTEQPKTFFSWLAMFEGRVQIINPTHLLWDFLRMTNILMDSIQNVINSNGTKKHRTP